MDEAPGASLVNALASTRQGNDTIFGWYARYLAAKEEGHDAVNGTAGILLENDGTLAINQVVDRMLREAPALEFSSYAPLKGLPDFLDLSISLALGEHRDALQSMGFGFVSTASPGGSGALFLAANNLCERGDAILLRDRHWGPYAGFLKGCGLEMATWPLLPETKGDYPYFADEAFEASVEQLAKNQNTVMVWLNDPAHNPTGLTMTAEGRRAALDIMMASASKYPDVGHTLLLDTAYSLYANEPHGWGQTIVDAMEDGTPWPENFLITYALSLSKSHTAYGLRTGALIGIHPDQSVTERLRDILEQLEGRRGLLHLESSNTLRHNCMEMKNLQRNGHKSENDCKDCLLNAGTCLSKHARNTACRSTQRTMDSLRGLNMMIQNPSPKHALNITSTSFHSVGASVSVYAPCQVMQSNESQRRLQPSSTR